MNNFISKIKKSISLNKIFSDAKCRLRLENVTRWGSAFLMLEAIKKAYSLDLFDSLNIDLKCPVAISVIKDYLNVLKPTYILNINLQRNSTSIAEVVPAVKIINKYEQNCYNFLDLDFYRLVKTLY